MLSIVVCIVSAKAYVQHNPSYYHGYDDEHDEQYSHPYNTHKSYNEHIEAHDYHVRLILSNLTSFESFNNYVNFQFNRIRLIINSAMVLKMHTPAIINKLGRHVMVMR